MSTLKPLVKEGQTEANLLDFSVDKKILLGVLSGKLNTEELATKLGISTRKLAGRKTSLVRRGHLEKKTVYKSSKYKKKTKENPFTNHDGPQKEIARTKIAKYIINSGVVGTIPTLPFSDCLIEKKIIALAPKNDFIGIEENLTTFKALKKTVKTEQLPITPYQGKFKDKIYGQSEDAYGHIIADYCGCLVRVHKEIEYIFQNNIIKRGGILALTLSIPTRGPGDNAEYIKTFGGYISNSKLDNNKDVIDSEMQVNNFIQNKRGNNFEILEKFNYQDERTPMTVIILRRK